MRGICTNCSKSSNHGSSKCQTKLCRTCNGCHTTSLHLVQNPSNKFNTDSKRKEINNSQVYKSQISNHSSIVNSNESMLSTALLDPGSQTSFITQSLFD